MASSPDPVTRSPKTAVPAGLPKNLERYLRKRKATFLTTTEDRQCNSKVISPVASPVKELSSPVRAATQKNLLRSEGDVLRNNESCSSNLSSPDSPSSLKKTMNVKPLACRAYTPLFSTFASTRSEPSLKQAAATGSCTPENVIERRVTTMDPSVSNTSDDSQNVCHLSLEHDGSDGIAEDYVGTK